ncbi:hypothetical protein P8625_13895 [Tenacibaculum tangerinum]|uniref:Uncharacterized protein n=1 Tax=Tenacibaculum tangerinum TaxID=3038772 RepID=A0ABY8L545_9FLAO|nr:hypothetical protein [Tenacibaculum tangerinum]WGH75149.1 hypothetical protein P8625_13895 [Tenacibaculum tangerinum]
MNKITIVLLLVICILLIGDLFLLLRIKKTITKKKKNKSDFDEKYFALKYDINLLRSITAIVVTILAFLGYSNFKDFNNEIKNTISQNIKTQTTEIDKINEKLIQYGQTIDSLEKLRNTIYSLMGNSENDLKKINTKIMNIDESFKNNPKVYVVNNLKYPVNEFNNNPITIYFKDMNSIHGEKLPKFKKIPFVNIQGYSIDLSIINVTREYVIVSLSSYIGNENDNYPRNYRFDLWVASY